MPAPVSWPAGSVVDVDSVGELLRFLAEGKLDRYTMVWRGVADVGWALDSSLVRKLAGDARRRDVTEKELRKAADELLPEARRLRFDRRSDASRLSDLELLATL